MDKDVEAFKKRAVEKLKNVEPRNYWNTSGKGRDCFPDEPDPKSIPKYRIKRDQKGKEISRSIPVEPENPWWIDSEENQHDFWIWVNQRSLPDGRMEPLQQNEIAKYFGCSATKIHFIIKDAFVKLKANGSIYALMDYLSHESKNKAITVNPNELDKDSD